MLKRLYDCIFITLGYKDSFLTFIVNVKTLLLFLKKKITAIIILHSHLYNTRQPLVERTETDLNPHETTGAYNLQSL